MSILIKSIEERHKSIMTVEALELIILMTKILMSVREPMLKRLFRNYQKNGLKKQAIILGRLMCWPLSAIYFVYRWSLSARASSSIRLQDEEKKSGSSRKSINLRPLLPPSIAQFLLVVVR